MRKLLLLLVLLTIPTLATPRGQYLVGEYDGESFELLLSFSGQKVTVKSLLQDWEHTDRLEKVGKHLYKFRVKSPGQSHQVTLIEMSKEEVVLSSPEENEVLRAVRLRDFPRELKGTWRVPGEGQGLSMEGSKVLLIDGEEQIEGKAYPLASKGAVHRLILASPSSPQEAILLNFVLLDRNHLLVWDEDDGETKRFEREGWMTP